MENLTKHIFTHTFQYPGPGKPWHWVEVGHSQESEDPWRGGISLVFRTPWTRTGRVIGVWLRENSEYQFHEAAGMRPLEHL